MRCVVCHYAVQAPDVLASESTHDDDAVVSALLAATASSARLTGATMEGAGELLGFALPADAVMPFPGQGHFVWASIRFLRVTYV